MTNKTNRYGGHGPSDWLGCSVDDWESDEEDHQHARASTLGVIVHLMLIFFAFEKSTRRFRHSNLLIENFEKRNKQGTIEYHLQQVKNANLKWRELQSAERHAYCERLSKLQGKGFGIPRVPSWTLFYDYNFKETLKNKMKYEYLHNDGDVFVDYSWERALSIYGDVYLERCLEFFSMMYFDKGVDRAKLMTEKLEVDDKLFNHEAFWQRIGKPTSTNPRTSLIKEPLIRIAHKLLVRSLVYRAGSKERCQKRDMWMMSALEESRGINLAWVIAEHLCKHAPGLKENSLICGGHYVTKIAHSLGYLNEEEVAKCLKPIDFLKLIILIYIT
ncbi:hypothetical protein Tco_1540119 [Tanacetum coccineum]